MLWFRCANIEQDVTSPSNRCSQMQQSIHACGNLKKINLSYLVKQADISSHLWSQKNGACCKFYAAF